MAEQLLEVRNLSIDLKKNNRSLKAVNDISFSIKKGEILGLAGESGCGKTLTALSITGLLSPNTKITGGEIIYYIDKKDISMIFQEYRESLNPLIKIGRQIRETLELGSGKDLKGNDLNDKKTHKRHTLEILRRLGFNEPKKIYNAYPHQLSGGMCQRVMAAIAAIGRPKLLLADEPSTALDTESQKRVLSLLFELNRKYGASILVISHDLSIIQKFCSRYLVMYAGKIVEEGPSQLLFSPLHPYTKALGNAIPGKEKKGNELETIPGKVPSIEDNLTGCPFAPRCLKAEKRCHEAFPPAAIETEGRRVHCYFPEEYKTTEGTE